MMLAQKRGNIINVASTYSLVAPNQELYKYPGETSQTYKPVDYVGTKSMVPNFTRYLATLYGRDGIRANCIVPHGVFNAHPQKFQDNFARLSPIGAHVPAGGAARAVRFPGVGGLELHDRRHRDDRRRMDGVVTATDR
jgi:NAD(P)-dependent dehydrogenase (short-subunit alcohol dehydrogenase family)